MNLPSRVQQSAVFGNAGPQLLLPQFKSPTHSSFPSQSPSDSPHGFSDVQHDPS